MTDSANVALDKEFFLELMADNLRYYPSLGRLFLPPNHKAALWLSNLIRWSGRGRRGEWVYKTTAEWFEETCLSRASQETVRKMLKKEGLIEERRMGKDGVLHYRVVWEELNKLALGMLESSKPECWNQANRNAGIKQTGMLETSKPYKQHNNNITTKKKKCTDCGKAVNIYEHARIDLCVHCFLRRFWLYHIEGEEVGGKVKKKANKAPRPGMSTSSHAKRITTLYRAGKNEWVEDFKLSVEIIASEPWLMSQDWVTFSYLLREGKIQKIIENGRVPDRNGEVGSGYWWKKYQEESMSNGRL